MHMTWNKTIHFLLVFNTAANPAILFTFSTSYYQSLKNCLSLGVVKRRSVLCLNKRCVRETLNYKKYAESAEGLKKIKTPQLAINARSCHCRRHWLQGHRRRVVKSKTEFHPCDRPNLMGKKEFDRILSPPHSSLQKSNFEFVHHQVAQENPSVSCLSKWRPRNVQGCRESR